MTELKAPARAAAYVAVLGLVLVVAFGVGRLVGPVDVEATPSHAGEQAGEHAGEHGGEHGGEHAETSGSTDVAGLTQEAGGYRLEPSTARSAPGAQPFAFTVVGPDGQPVTAYDEAHERDLHLVVVRRDLTGFQHVHPTLDPATGTWTTTLALEPGSWRVLADFVPAGGAQTVLGADLMVEGAATTLPLGPDVLEASADGYQVNLDLGTPVAGGETAVVATVRQGGEPVTDLGEYLGELGHLVVLRDGDLGYVHAHPEESAGAGPEIEFSTTFPSDGRYRLFLEFEHEGAVQLAEFTVSVGVGDGQPTGHGDEGGSHEH